MGFSYALTSLLMMLMVSLKSFCSIVGDVKMILSALSVYVNLNLNNLKILYSSDFKCFLIYVSKYCFS